MQVSSAPIPSLTKSATSWRVTRTVSQTSRDYYHLRRGSRHGRVRGQDVADFVSEGIGADETCIRSVKEGTIRVERQAAVNDRLEQLRSERIRVEINVVFSTPGAAATVSRGREQRGSCHRNLWLLIGYMESDGG